jgi:alpha-ketoglutarate-dependent taurine dioxygenase
VTVLNVERLGLTVGAEVSGVDADDLAHEAGVAEAVLDALEANGVLVFRGLHLDPDAQVAFAKRLGEVDYEEGYHPVKGISRITRDEAKRPTASYIPGTFLWHIDGCTPLHDESPQKATILTALAVSDTGGETEFASTYVAYDQLDEGEKARFSRVQVLHSFESSMRKTDPNATPAQIETWRRRPAHVNPLVWTHRSGRRSLVLGSSADHVLDMEVAAGRDLLDDLLARTTAPERVYRQQWNVGDTVIWDNRGVVHRALPYSADSPREMLRTTVLGDEPIQ